MIRARAPAQAEEVGGASLAAALQAARANGRLQLANRELQSFPLAALGLNPVDKQGEKWWEAQELRHCDLSHNVIQELPPELCQSVSLVTLRVASNKLASLPQMALPSLTLLDLSHNRLEALPDSFGRGIPSLRELVLTGNRLSSLPESFGSLQTLVALRVSGNALASLPGSIGGALLIEEIDASDNRLERLPALQRLVHLRQLFLPRNRLRDISLDGLSSLAVLDVSENRLVRFPTPPVPASHLARVMLAHNAICGIDTAALLALAPSCVEMHLQGNSIAALPRELGAMTALRVLNLADNDVSRLPPELGYLPSLTRIALTGNPLRTVRRQLLEGSVEDLKVYLRTRGPAYQADETDLVAGAAAAPATATAGSGAAGVGSAAARACIGAAGGASAAYAAADIAAEVDEVGGSSHNGLTAATARGDAEKELGRCATIGGANNESKVYLKLECRDAPICGSGGGGSAGGSLQTQRLRAEADALEEQADAPGISRAKSMALKRQAQAARAAAAQNRSA